MASNACCTIAYHESANSTLLVEANRRRPAGRLASLMQARMLKAASKKADRLSGDAVAKLDIARRMLSDEFTADELIWLGTAVACARAYSGRQTDAATHRETYLQNRGDRGGAGCGGDC